MVKTPSSTGKPSNLKAEFMIIKIGYSCQLLFSIEVGAEFLKTYCLCEEYKKDYNKTAELTGSPPSVEISYLTKHDIAKIRFDETLGLKDDA